MKFCLVQSLSHIHLFATSWTAAHWASPSLTISWSLLKFMSIELVTLSNQLILYLHCILSYACMLSRFSDVQLCATLWIAACQSPLTMGFSRQEYWSGLPCPPPGDLSDPGVELLSLSSTALTDVLFPTSATWEAQICTYLFRFLLYSRNKHNILKQLYSN